MQMDAAVEAIVAHGMVAELVEGHTDVHAGRSTSALLEFEQAYASSAKEMLHFSQLLPPDWDATLTDYGWICMQDSLVFE